MDLTPQRKGEFAKGVFEAWFAADAIRARFAKRQREAILQQQANGKDPSGYRPEWIFSTARKIAAVIQEAKADFERQWCWDRIIEGDIEDVLTNAGHLLHDEDQGAKNVRNEPEPS